MLKEIIPSKAKLSILLRLYLLVPFAVQTKIECCLYLVLLERLQSTHDRNDQALKEKRAIRKKILSKRLTQILKEKNLSQTELALKTNLTDQVISDYCGGRAIPRSAGLLKIASVLDIHEGWLLGDFDETKPFPMETKSKELLNVKKYLLLE